MVTDTMTRQAHSLIPSDQVEGTHVRRSDGTKIGTIKRIMIDKISGKVTYAVLNFGGFLGMGEKHFPVPWERMKYNPSLEAYEINLTEQELLKAPSYDSNTDFDWGDRTQERLISDFYKVPGYWS